MWFSVSSGSVVQAKRTVCVNILRVPVCSLFVLFSPTSILVLSSSSDRSVLVVVIVVVVVVVVAVMV